MYLFSDFHIPIQVRQFSKRQSAWLQVVISFVASATQWKLLLPSAPRAASLGGPLAAELPWWILALWEWDWFWAPDQSWVTLTFGYFWKTNVTKLDFPALLWDCCGIGQISLLFLEPWSVQSLETSLTIALSDKLPWVHYNLEEFGVKLYGSKTLPRQEFFKCFPLGYDH